MQGVARRRTVATVYVGFGVLVVLVLAGWLLWLRAGGDDYQQARATVVEVAQCGAPGATDRLKVELLDGQTIDARLDGCGYPMGEMLTVEVPDPLPGGDVTARVAGTGVPVGMTDERRLSALLVVGAAAAGAVLAWRLLLVRR